MMYNVSIIVPVYNVAPFFERCLHSLFGQTYQNIQYIFVNDCTPDNSIEILERIYGQYPERQDDIKILSHKENRGLAAARNTGVANADGEYIIHIDSDDYVELTMVQEMINKAEEENADIVICDLILQWERVEKTVSQKFENKEQYLRDLLNTSALPSVWNKMFRRKLYVENNISAAEGINVGEDLVVTPRLVYYATKITKLDKAFVHYVQFNSNSYTKNISDKNIDDVLRVLGELKYFFEQKSDASQYLSSLMIGRLRKKVEFLKQIDSERIALIISRFPEMLTVELESNFNVFDRLLLSFSKNKNVFLKTLLFGYRNVFTAVQVIKRR